MRKASSTIITFILVVILGFIGVSCTPSQQSQFISYTDDTNGFSIDYPQGWDVEPPPVKSKPELLVSIWSKKFGINPVGIQVAKYRASGYNLENFAEFQIGALPAIAKDYASVSTEPITVNSVPAIVHVYNSTVGQTSYKRMKVYLMEKETGWILGFDCPEKSYYFYKPTFDTSFNSFSLLR